MELKEFKELYSKLEKKYGLPSFKEINEDFEVEKIDRGSETYTRTLRKVMMEKVVNSISFLDMLLSPVNAPRIYVYYIKSLSPEDRKTIDKIYETLSELSIGSLELEIDYSEKKEAEMVKKIFETWNSTKPLFREILESMKKPNSQDGKKEKSYFG